MLTTEPSSPPQHKPRVHQRSCCVHPHHHLWSVRSGYLSSESWCLLFPNERFFVQVILFINHFVGVCRYTSLIVWKYFPIRAWAVFIPLPLRILQVCGTHRPHTLRRLNPGLPLLKVETSPKPLASLCFLIATNFSRLSAEVDVRVLQIGDPACSERWKRIC